MEEPRMTAMSNPECGPPVRRFAEWIEVAMLGAAVAIGLAGYALLVWHGLSVPVAVAR